MKILITGSSGFIGKKIIEIFKNDESILIIRTTRHKENIKKNVFYYDIFQNQSNTNLFEYFGCPDIVLHCAWDNVKNSNYLSHINDQVNYHIKFIDNLVRNGLKKITVLGTCHEYGRNNGESLETQIVNPITNYGIAKDFLRRYIENLNKEHEFIYQWIRIFNVYDKTGKTGNNNLISQLRNSVDNKESTFNMTYGEKKLDFIEINELCFMIIKIIMQNKINGIINCCSGSPQTILDLINNCLKDWGETIDLNRGYYNYREYEPDCFYGSTKKLNSILYK